MNNVASLYDGPRHLPLEGTVWILGRQEPAELVFPLPQISRRHALLEFRDGGYYVSDLGSRFGTYCQGKEVKSEGVRVQDGDDLVLGGVLSLRFHDPAETQGGRRLGRLTAVWLDDASGEVWVDGLLVQPTMSTTQFRLLHLLRESEDKFLTRDEVCQGLWPDQCQEGISEEALDALIKRVRARLRELSGDAYLEVKRGRGLRLRSQRPG